MTNLTKKNLKPLIYDVTPADLEAFLASTGEPKYRLDQVNQWLARGVLAVDDMTNVSKKLRELMAEQYKFNAVVAEKIIHSELDATTKYVFGLRDGQGVESVYMQYHTGTSVCLSTQAGCRMGCKFCASTGIGFGRNLTAGELFAQLIFIARDRNCRIDNVVLMGIGEPMENLPEVVRFLRLINNPKGFNIGMRHVTISTCGLVPEIRRLADEGLPVTLAISLHAPNDELRKYLMPIANRYSIPELLEAGWYYADKTGRRLTFEYALFKGVNDSLKEAKELVQLLKGKLAHVNLIPANEFEGGLFKRSTPEDTKAFYECLKQAGIPCTVRRELGGDISAACGQLRRKRGTTK